MVNVPPAPRYLTTTSLPVCGESSEISEIFQIHFQVIEILISFQIYNFGLYHVSFLKFSVFSEVKSELPYFRIIHFLLFVNLNGSNKP